MNRTRNISKPTPIAQSFMAFCLLCNLASAQEPEYLTWQPTGPETFVAEAHGISAEAQFLNNGGNDTFNIQDLNATNPEFIEKYGEFAIAFGVQNGPAGSGTNSSVFLSFSSPLPQGSYLLATDVDQHDEQIYVPFDRPLLLVEHIEFFAGENSTESTWQQFNQTLTGAPVQNELNVSVFDICRNQQILVTVHREFESGNGGSGFAILIPPPVLLGDVNMDGTVDLLDVGPFVDSLNTGQYLREADMNMDCQLNLLDVSLFVDALAG